MSNNNETPPPRRRGITSITLGWLAEKLRKTEKIKEQLAEGTYKVDPQKVAAAMVNKE